MNRIRPGSIPRALLCVVLFVVASGCSKVTLENYDRLKVGMDYAEVVRIIGEPDECSEAIGTRACRWGNSKKNIKVTFFASKATLFSAEGLN